LFGETWLTRPIGENIQDFLDVVMSRQSQLIQSISLAAHVTPETIPFRYGRDYFMLPVYILFPRLIWPEKPVQAGSVQFSIDYAGAPANTIHSTAVTLFGDLYLNFGLPGILGGMFLLGILYRWIYGAVRDAGSHSRLVLYLGLFTWMTNIEGEIVGVIQGTFQQLIIFYVLTSLMYRKAIRLEANSNEAEDVPVAFQT
jgi:oligosaccharide repeat unit polymerase